MAIFKKGDPHTNTWVELDGETLEEISGGYITTGFDKDGYLGWYVVDDNNGSYIGFAPKNHFQDARKIALDNGMSDALITDAQLRRLREGLTINGDRGSEKVALRTSFRGAYLLVLLDNLCAC